MDLLIRVKFVKLIKILAILAISSFKFSQCDNILGKDCKVMQVPMNTHEFNLNPLHRGSDFLVISDFSVQFLINICGSLVKDCNGHKNASVCLIKTDNAGIQTELAIGYTNNSVIYDNGKLQFELQGEKCDNGKNTSVTIIMMCDHLGDKGPELIPAFRSNCTFFFVWYNNASCTPRKLIDCIIHDTDGVTYDLGRLTLPANNYVAIKKDNRGGPLVKILLNVCQSVVMVHDFACEYNSGSCATTVAVNDTQKLNLGDVTNGPYFEYGVLKLKYENGDVCSQDVHFSTIIEFICDTEQHDSNPKFHRLIHSCEYHFLWKTSAACPPQSWSSASLPIQPSHNSLGSEDCIVTSAITGDWLDLRFLRGKDYEMTLKGGQMLRLSACGPLTNSTCGNASGACIYANDSNESFSAGQANANLKFQDTQPYLYYSNGSTCRDQQTWNTQIIFECNTQYDKGEGPKSFLNYGCEYIIIWFTRLACERDISCTATNADRIVDLSYFARKMDNYLIYLGTNKILLNICRKINPLSGVACPHRSGACIIANNKPLSLGYFISPPVLDADGIIVLKYLNGSRCPGHVNTKLSSVFRFICEVAAGYGRPSFKETVNDGCEYQFDWRTSIVCEEEIEELSVTSDGCLIQDRMSHITTDLSSLHQDGGHHVSDKSGRNYSINLCGSNDTCDGAAVCEVLKDAWTSYGQLVSIVHDFSENLTKMFYTKGAPCDLTGNWFNSAEVWLKCADGIGIGQPVVLESDSCFVLFEWRTTAACGKITQMSDGVNRKKAGNEIRNHRIGVRFGLIALTLTLVGVLFGLWMMGVFRKCSQLKSLCCSWTQHRGTSNHVAYSRQAGIEDEFCMQDED